MTTISIVGYEQNCHCEHCGRALVHGIRISDGRIVGATCLDKKLTAPKVYKANGYSTSKAIKLTDCFLVIIYA